MSFTNLTTKTELVESLQHFTLNVKMYKNVTSTQTTYFALFVLSNDGYYYKKRTVYNILRYKFLRNILSYSSFPLTDIYENKPV